MQINVKDTKVHERNFTDKNGRPQIIREQRAAVDLGDGYEMPFLVGLGTGPVNPVGAYSLDPNCFTVNRFGSLELGRVKLVPVVVRSASAARTAPQGG